MKITCIHPSRQRPYQAFDACMEWLTKAGDKPIQYILSLDTDDPQMEEYIRVFNQLSGWVRVLINPNRSIVDAVNNGAKKATGDLFVVVSDDFSCPDKWDRELKKAAGKKTDYIIRTNDGTGSWLITLPILSKAYYQREGFIYNPDYRHLFCDTEYTHKAILMVRVIETDLVFPHNHYTTGRTKKDAVNDKANSTWNQGMKVYLTAVSNNFGLKPDQIKGQFTDPSHIEWLRKEGVVI